MIRDRRVGASCVFGRLECSMGIQTYNMVLVLVLLLVCSAYAEYNLGVGIADVTGPVAGITLVSYTIFWNFFGISFFLDGLWEYGTTRKWNPSQAMGAIVCY